MSTNYNQAAAAHPTSPQSPEAKLQYHLGNGHPHPHQSPMDGRQGEYQQPEQPPPPQYPPGQDPRSANFSSSATPTSEYGLPPSSARSGSFPEYIQRPPQYTPNGNGPPTGGLPHQQNPSIAQSPTYPPQSPYSPYTPGHSEMAQHYAGAPGVYGRPEWASQHFPHGPPMGHYGHPVSSGPPSGQIVSPTGHPLSTVYSFVPIPGAQQHKRPRRRYEEIERMYKCGWEGCEKAYGTLNHLNAHVTMQSHGLKRTPEEFKEIRKEWKQKKKEEEATRKAEEERNRAAQEAAAPRPPEGTPGTNGYGHGQQMRTPTGAPIGGPQLPPIGYSTPVSGQSQPGYGAPSPAMDMPQQK